jgi:ubiquinone/menaquinone biosynthesis C-methylase UbiE
MPENRKTMSQSRQTLESIQADFDRIALLSDDGWDHNAHYHRYLMNHIPKHCLQILEIGCGTGQFSRLLAARAERVLALDLSPQMIRLARERSRLYPNIDFVTADVLTSQLPDNQFDCIATLTTIHHLPIEPILRKIREALKPGGVFVCLDLYQRSSLKELLFDCVAYSADLFLRLINTGRPRPSSDVSAAYAEHGKTDTYLKLPQLERICADILPGALISRHLFWRYSIIWKKEVAEPAVNDVT